MPKGTFRWTCPLAFCFSFFQAVFFPFKQLVELFDQLQKPVAIMFLLNQGAQLIHAFAFVRCHRQMG